MAYVVTASDYDVDTTRILAIHTDKDDADRHARLALQRATGLAIRAKEQIALIPDTFKGTFRLMEEQRIVREANQGNEFDPEMSLHRHLYTPNYTVEVAPLNPGGPRE